VDNFNTVLKIIGAIIGIMAIIFPVVAAAVMWKMSQRFATRPALRGAVKRFESKLDDKVKQIERDIERDHKEVMRAIKESQEATSKQINGVGERVLDAQRQATEALAHASATSHSNDMLAQRINSLDEHGTKKAVKLEEQITRLSENLTLFNKLIQQGVLQAGPVPPQTGLPRSER
jgi:uncharacterized protein involved in exopolysaccharide biosynthesis